MSTRSLISAIFILLACTTFAQVRSSDKAALPGDEILITTGRPIAADSIVVSFAGTIADIIEVTGDSVRVLVPKGKEGPLTITVSTGYNKKERLPFTMLAYPAKKIYFQRKGDSVIKVREEMTADGSPGYDMFITHYAFDMLDRNNKKVASGVSFSTEEKEVFGGPGGSITKYKDTSVSMFSVTVPNEKGDFKLKLYKLPHDTDSLDRKIIDKHAPSTFLISNR
ncbi:hypothetical protein GCM10023093_19480 [Nemorincola caseinilytica]|uniref:IPT/TIG domain-containing protein n=1 Tax=Nemorincola caseinilytica TaxID=2054315 RepID=A0ABP8NIU0_9BACT